MKTVLSGTYADIEDADGRLRFAQEQYVKRHGWKVTCNTPGSYWMWQRDFTAEHAAALARWKERGPGPMGMPIKPQSYGHLTVTLEMAVSMTRAVLDRDEDDDGECAL